MGFMHETLHLLQRQLNRQLGVPDEPSTVLPRRDNTMVAGIYFHDGPLSLVGLSHRLTHVELDVAELQLESARAQWDSDCSSDESTRAIAHMRRNVWSRFASVLDTNRALPEDQRADHEG
jgi:hypothetical protein